MHITGNLRDNTHWAKLATMKHIVIAAGAKKPFKIAMLITKSTNDITSGEFAAEKCRWIPPCQVGEA